MARGRDSLLGLGGQRKKLSKNTLRGNEKGQQGGAADPLEEKRELLRKMREKTEQGSTTDG
ncbi:DUF6243 family protein [Actinorugispora endophytica]|uniref:Uncharacterized protein n=1 Tax=Actinorugispora endophytica TaxID=1605990 RepID=A0A4V3D9A0_9ACTN|nr:DUF6243 family protein [Actinorugispora endophytica]TDQ55300.1 hypothetical protein EV190_101625 [Actinorugispora endophytica]